MAGDGALRRFAFAWGTLDGDAPLEGADERAEVVADGVPHCVGGYLFLGAGGVVTGCWVGSTTAQHLRVEKKGRRVEFSEDWFHAPLALIKRVN